MQPNDEVAATIAIETGEDFEDTFLVIPLRLKTRYRLV